MLNPSIPHLIESMSTKRINLLAIILCLCAGSIFAQSDSIPSMFSRPMEWHIGAEVSPAWVPGSNVFLKGNNPLSESIDKTFSGSIRGSFSFNPTTREGMLYKGLYQGIGISANPFFPTKLLGTPISAYVFQGAPITHLSSRLWLGYEWQFGAAFGWKHDGEESRDNTYPVSTAVTAHMALALKLHYNLSERWQLIFGINAKHYSNGNTSLPNPGVNSLGASLGITYVINPQKSISTTPQFLEEEADRGRWVYDITAFGAWRKRIVNVGYLDEQVLCPGKFGVLGLQFSPMRRLNRWVAVGPALDAQWDEGAGLKPYWVDGSYDEDIKFKRPPFGKQLSVGVSAHAELTMPIFSVNVGMGYDIVNPKGDKAFFQSLTLKTFITKRIYLNTGYRLGNFKDPQNLMLGVGIRL